MQNTGSKVSECATRQDVDKIVSLAEKCRRLSIDQEEFTLLFELSLFNQINSDAGVMYARVANARIRRRLQVKCCSVPERYASLLMVLPDLHGIKTAKVESLFCTQVVKSYYAQNMDQLITQWFIESQ